MLSSNKKLEAKHEKIIKELLRIGDNRRCVDCDSIGPQYVVSAFNVFVCTSCSGVHRQFGHRVKGISMCTFSADEVAALQAGGNEKFLATYCATWTPTALTRPIDRHPDRTKQWIETIYVTKRFFTDIPSAQPEQSEQPAPDTPASETAVTATTSNGVAASVASVGDGDVAVLSLEGLLGKDMPRLQVSIPGASAAAAAAVSASSVSVHSTPGAGSKPASSISGSPLKAPTPKAVQIPVQEAAVVVPPPPMLLDLLDHSPAVAVGAPAAEPWDPFAPPPPPRVTVAPVETSSVAPVVVQSKPVSPITSPMEQLAGFGASASSAATAAPAVAPAAESWSAFGDDTHTSFGNGNTAPASSSSSSPTKAAAVENQAQEGGGWAAFGASNGSTSFSQPVAAPSQAPVPNATTPAVSNSQPKANIPQLQPAQTAPAAVVVDSRREVPLDVFYPEFAKIRATGVLPTGQLVPGTLPPQYGMPPPSPASQLAPSPYGQHPSSVSGFSPTGYIQSPTPTPSGSSGGGGQYQHYPVGTPSPAGPGHQQQQPSFYQTTSPGWQHTSPQLPQQQHFGAPSPAGSTASQSWSSMPSPAAAAPQAASNGLQQVKLGTDPFAGLGSTFSGALPNVNTSPMPGGYGVILPPQQQAPAAPQTAAASATLFGVNTSLTAYDLSAPSAPKAASSGNPFA